MSAPGTGAWQTPGFGTPDRRASGSSRAAAGGGGAFGDARSVLGAGTRSRAAGEGKRVSARRSQVERVIRVVEPPPATPAEQHVGDRLAALVDGELGHDARERVLAHLATCDECRTEADEQRRLKSVFAAASSIAPGPSEGLLARLQGLPGRVDGASGGDADGTSGPLGGRALGASDRLGSGLDSGGGSSQFRGPLAVSMLPNVGQEGAAVGSGAGPGSGGFRFHDFTRAVRPSGLPRGRRFAVAAAGAFSLAAVVLGALPVDDLTQSPRTEEPGSVASPSAAGPGVLDSSGDSGPFFMNAPVSVVSVHQPMRSHPSAPPAPWVTPSPLGGPGKGAANR